MIWESQYWKEELLRKADALDRYKQQRRWPDRASARAERLLMTGFFEIRKLLDSHKLSEEVTNATVLLLQYKASGLPVHLLNHHNIQRLYDLESGRLATKGLRFICNQIVHSYVFGLVMLSSKELWGIVFSSDRDRTQSLYQLELSSIIGTFRQVARDDPNFSEARWNTPRGDYDYTLKAIPR
jgi:hypothetical protein